jgi:Fibronectin type III domain
MSLSFTQAQNSTDCKPPNELFASVRDTIASLNWKSAVANSAYIVQYKLRNESVWKTESLTTNTLILRGLKPCSEYQFKVKSVCSITASSDYSEIKVFKTNGCVAPCLSPREVKGITGDSKAAFSWVSTGSYAYEIQYQDASNNGELVQNTTSE